MFSGNRRFPITEFSGNCSKLNQSSRNFFGNHIAAICSNSCSSPVHIASHCAETRPNFPVILWQSTPEIFIYRLFRKPNEIIDSTNKNCRKYFWRGGVLWNKARRAMRAMGGKALETLPFQLHFGCTENFLKALSNFTVKVTLPSNKSNESKTGCNRTPATVLWVLIINSQHLNMVFLRAQCRQDGIFRV